MDPDLLPLTLLGATAGLSTGAVGMGAGAILAPGLLYLGWAPVEVVTATLFVGWFIRVLATLLAYGSGDWSRSTGINDLFVEQWLIKLAVIGAVPGAVAGTLISHHVSAPQLRRAIGVMLLTIAGIEAVRMLARRGPRHFTLRAEVPVGLGFVGAATAAVTGIGTGTVVGGGLRLAYRGLTTAVVARATLVTAMFALTAVIVLRMPQVAIFGQTLPLLIGAVVGTALGGFARDVLPERALRMALVTTIALSGLRIVIT